MAVVLWDEHPGYGLTVVPEERMKGTLSSVDVLRSATTLGELWAADLQPWADRMVYTFVENAEDDERTVDGDTPWEFDTGMLLDDGGAPFPDEFWPTAEWLGEDFLRAHADYVHATSPMDVDRYRVRDKDAFFAALESRGFTLQRRPGLMDEFRSNF